MPISLKLPAPPPGLNLAEIMRVARKNRRSFTVRELAAFMKSDALSAWEKDHDDDDFLEKFHDFLEGIGYRTRR